MRLSSTHFSSKDILNRGKAGAIIHFYHILAYWVHSSLYSSGFKTNPPFFPTESFLQLVPETLLCNHSGEEGVLFNPIKLAKRLNS